MSADTAVPAIATGESESARLVNSARNEESNSISFYKLQGRLLKAMRTICRLEDGDHIMVCVSGGKDSATLLHLLLLLQEKLKTSSPKEGGGARFDLTVVHVDQKQPGYNGTALVHWLDGLNVAYRIRQEDTYSVAVDKTAEGKSFCTLCSRLRRGILYSAALELGCNKLCWDITRITVLKHCS